MPEDLHKLLLQRGKVPQPQARPPQARPQLLPQRPQRGWCSPPRMCMPSVPSSTSHTGCITCWALPGCWCWTSSTPWTGSSTRLAPPHRYMHVSQAYVRCKPVGWYRTMRVGKSPHELCFVALTTAQCAVLCCAVLCCAVLCCAVLCCAVLCCAVLCCAVLCCAVLCFFSVSLHHIVLKAAMSCCRTHGILSI